jgi:hypothetical protein
MKQEHHKRWVGGKITRGHYAGLDFEIDFGDGFPETASVKVGGKDISSLVSAIHVHLRSEDQCAQVVLELIGLGKEYDGKN